MNQYMIAPSILSADFAQLGAEAQAVLDGGADMIHFDVMDNHYVPNLTIGPGVCAALRQYGITAPIDVHLMVKPVDRLIGAFAEAGATWISIHPEATEHLHRSLSLIRQHGCHAGLAFNPSTPLDYLDYLWDQIDLILIMTVNPGFGGQQFIEVLLPKIEAAHQQRLKHNPRIRLQVDGGINLETIGPAAAAGADTFVAGSAIFNQPNYQQAIEAMRTQLNTTTS